MGQLHIRDDVNEHGTAIGVFKCFCCDGEFTICPAPTPEKRKLYERDGCGDAECDSYIPSRDCGVLFGDYGMFNRYCDRKGIDRNKLSGQLMDGGPERLTPKKKTPN